MRTLIALATLASTAHAEPIHPQVIASFARFGPAHIDGINGMAVGFSAEGRLVIGPFSVGLDAGVGGLSCKEPCGLSDISYALHVGHPLHKPDRHGLWFGGGPALHRISTMEVGARGETIERNRVRWQPGLDLLLAFELRDRKEGFIGGHLGLRAFALRSDERVMAKPVSSTRESHGIDGGLWIETGLVYGR